MTQSTPRPLGHYFKQVGYVVDDLDKAIETWKKIFGIPGFVAVKGDFQMGPEHFWIRGKPGVMKLHFAVGDMPGGPEVELVQPLDENGISGQLLKRHGSGCSQELGFRVPECQPYFDYFTNILGHKPWLHGGSGPRPENPPADYMEFEFAQIDCREAGISDVEIYSQSQEGLDRMHPYVQEKPVSPERS